MVQQKRPTLEEFRALVGVKRSETVFEIDKSMISRFCEAVGEPNSKWQETAPPSFLIPSAFLGEIVKTIWPYPRLVDAGADWEFYKPVRLHDVITTVSELADVQDKSGDKGQRILISLKSTYKNQDGETVAESTGRLMNFE